MTQIGTLENLYKLPDPQDELDRAVSDYLYISRNPQMYVDTAGYEVAEERAWKRLWEAHLDLNVN